MAASMACFDKGLSPVAVVRTWQAQYGADPHIELEAAFQVSKPVFDAYVASAVATARLEGQVVSEVATFDGFAQTPSWRVTWPVCSACGAPHLGVGGSCEAKQAYDPVLVYKPRLEKADVLVPCAPYGAENMPVRLTLRKEVPCKDAAECADMITSVAAGKGSHYRRKSRVCIPIATRGIVVEATRVESIASATDTTMATTHEVEVECAAAVSAEEFMTAVVGVATAIRVHAALAFAGSPPPPCT